MTTTIPPSDITEALKVITPLAAPLVKSLLDAFVIPSVKSVYTKLSKPSATSVTDVSHAFSEYLLRYYAKLSFVNTLAFPNQQILISDIYLPLTVRCTEEKARIQIIKWEESFIPKYQRVLLIDTAGMGKSTLMKWLFLQAIDSCARVPLFVELKTLSPDTDLVDHFLAELGSYDKPFDRELFLELLKRGDFAFFFDGYDEIPQEHREKITGEIQNFVSRAATNFFALSSRKDPALASFGEFKGFHIAPLRPKEAFALLHKYDKRGLVAEKIISEIENTPQTKEQLKELLKNPLLVSLLFKCYSFKPKIPLRKPVFYRQVFDALYESHDFSKTGGVSRKKHCRLDIDDFHAILRELGFATAKLGRVDLHKDALLLTLKEIASRRKDIPFQESEFLLDLITTVPLFSVEGENYNWAHKSVQDYFAAQYIYMDAGLKQASILNAIYESKNGHRFSNVLDILFETEPKIVRNLLFRKLLLSFKQHHEQTYRADFGPITAEALETRRAVTFLRKFVIFRPTVQKDDDPIQGILSQGQELLGDNKLTSLTFGAVCVADSTAPGIVVLELFLNKLPACCSLATSSGNPNQWPLASVTFVSDDPSEKHNSPALFEITTSLLFRVGRRRLRTDAALRALSEIELEISQFDANHLPEVGI